MLKRKLAMAAISLGLIFTASGCSSKNDSAADDEAELDDMEAEEATMIDDNSQYREDFSATTPVDNEYVTLSVDSITENIDSDEYSWSAVLANKSDQLLYTSVRGMSINDYVISEPEYDSAIEAGEQKAIVITFSGSDLVKNDIEEVAKASFDFYVSDENGEVLTSTTAVMYPHGEAYYEKPDRVRFSQEEIVFDNEYGKLIITGFDSYSYTYETDIFFDNKTDGGLILDVTDESGYTYSFLDETESAETSLNINYVPAGGRTNTEILMTSDEEAAEPSNVKFHFSLRNPVDNSIAYEQSVEVAVW